MSFKKLLSFQLLPFLALFPLFIPYDDSIQRLDGFVEHAEFFSKFSEQNSFVTA